MVEMAAMIYGLLSG